MEHILKLLLMGSIQRFNNLTPLIDKTFNNNKNQTKIKIMIKAKLKKLAMKLYQEEYSYGEISKEIDVPRSTVYRWITTALEYDYYNDEGLDNNETGVSSFGDIMEQHNDNMSNNGTLSGNKPKANSINNRKITPDLHNIANSTDENLHYSPHTPEDCSELLFEIDELKKVYDKLQKDYELEQRRNRILIDSNHNLSCNLTEIREEHSILESESILNNALSAISVEELDNEVLPPTYIKLLASQITEFLDWDGHKLTINIIKSLIKLQEILKSDIYSWADDYEYDLDSEIVSKVLLDLGTQLGSVLKLFSNSESEEILVSINVGWMSEMEEWLDGVDN